MPIDRSIMLLFRRAQFNYTRGQTVRRRHDLEPTGPGTANQRDG
jgi:hypothetical protein